MGERFTRGLMALLILLSIAGLTFADGHLVHVTVYEKNCIRNQCGIPIKTETIPGGRLNAFPIARRDGRLYFVSAGHGFRYYRGQGVKDFAYAEITSFEGKQVRAHLVGAVFNYQLDLALLSIKDDARFVLNKVSLPPKHNSNVKVAAISRETKSIKHIPAVESPRFAGEMAHRGRIVCEQKTERGMSGGAVWNETYDAVHGVFVAHQYGEETVAFYTPVVLVNIFMKDLVTPVEGKKYERSETGNPEQQGAPEQRQSSPSDGGSDSRANGGVQKDEQSDSGNGPADGDGASRSERAPEKDQRSGGSKVKEIIKYKVRSLAAGEILSMIGLPSSLAPALPFLGPVGVGISVLGAGIYGYRKWSKYRKKKEEQGVELAKAKELSFSHPDDAGSVGVELTPEQYADMKRILEEMIPPKRATTV